jgi:hypothetical protein
LGHAPLKQRLQTVVLMGFSLCSAHTSASSELRIYLQFVDGPLKIFFHTCPNNLPAVFIARDTALVVLILPLTVDHPIIRQAPFQESGNA